MIGRALGHYRILEKIGAGGMGEVYRAHDEQLDRDVALKVLPATSFADPAARARLLREARTASKLNHPHICTIHEVGEADGQAYIAMELVEGRPLSELLGGGPLPIEQALRYGSQIADALAHAHERGIVHRDLKSLNVMVTPEGRAKVLDFGLAKQLREQELEEVTRSQASLTAEGAVMGTLAYMAPEQLRGQPADTRSDIWALGVVLHEMSAGERPFQRTSGYELSAAILREKPGPLPAKVPLSVRAVIERCLAKEPGERYQRASEVRAALEAVATGAVAPWVGVRYALRRRPAVALAAAVVLLLAGVVGLNVGGVREKLFGPGPPKIESIAVLPLENISGDPEQDYFAEGMHEALITDLAKLSGLKRVIARTSVMRYQKTDKPLPQIAGELGVDAVMTGSVLRSGDRIRITAQLINARTEEHLWADRYERDLRDVLTLQNELVSSIARQIELKLTSAEASRLARARPVNPEAHQAYLKGRYFWETRTKEGLEKALAYFETAIRIDPSYALGYVGLADTYALLGTTRFLAPQASYPKARAAAQQALELDENLAEAHASLALVLRRYDWDWQGAEREFNRALELNPGYANAHNWRGLFLSEMGRQPEALAAMRKARELDPLSPTINTNLAGLLWIAREYDQAIQEFQKALELFPDFANAHIFLGETFLEVGRPEEAIAEFRRGVALRRGTPFASLRLARALARVGKRQEAEKIVETMLKARTTQFVPPFELARAYTSLGEKDKAFAWLEKGYAERDPWMTYLRVDPAFGPLRGEPRFRDLLRRMNFPAN